MLTYSAADFEDFREPRPDLPTSLADLNEVVGDLVETAGRSDSTRPTTSRSRSSSTCSKRSTATSPSTACMVLRSRRNRDEPATSNASRRSAAASPSSTVWRTRASTSSTATAQGRGTHASGRRNSADGTPSRGRHRRHSSRQPQPVVLPVVARHRKDGRRALAVPGGQPRASRTALRLYTQPVRRTRRRREQGALAVGQYADLAVLSDNYFEVDAETINGIGPC